MMDTPMFCFQCQETAGCKGCTRVGVCGKTPEVAGLQDLLVYVTKGTSALACALRDAGKEVPVAVDRMVTLNLFTTITNANFDAEAVTERIERTLACRVNPTANTLLRLVYTPLHGTGLELSLIHI